ncbi:MAG TPA: dTDP-4-dehydrorhamnose reductase [Chthoniobacteraceae bacterium]|nr:dTDP-4-dehydrorhamnose reductase [Chthoniobacteraceae bacterium]
MNPLRIVIVGSGGRLGAALHRIYSGVYEVTGFDRKTLDLKSNADIESKLHGLSFDVLINCAALTNVDYCEDHGAEALQINAHAVRALAEICAKKNAKCIHFSTDYVFDGKATKPYAETDPALPISIYGESKLIGEKALLEVSAKNLAVRVSWVFGPDRPSFIDQVLKTAATSGHVQAVADKIGAPTFTLDVAAHLNPFLRDIAHGGLLHLSNTGECSWQEYGRFALECAEAAGLPLKTTEVTAQKLAELKAFKARRPVYTVLSTDLLAKLTGHPPRHWHDAVEDYVFNYYALEHKPKGH